MQARSFVEVETPHGKVRVKVASDGYYAPEYEDCRELALDSGVALKHIIAEANYAYLNNRDEILPHHSHLLRQCRAAHRPRLYHHRGRPDQALQSACRAIDAVLTTGSDEHGVNVERAGRARRQVAARIHRRHRRRIRSASGRCWACRSTISSAPPARSTPAWSTTCSNAAATNGYVYKGSYTGQYCIFDNLYVNDAKPGDPCPDCGRPTETITEENFFFKLSAFQDELLELYERDPDFIQPETRRNEVISFVKAGLTDLSITRTNIKWGIPVVGEAPHVFYVWFDALTTYMSAVDGETVDGENLWPADLHLIGKEIVRFHAVYWPAFLMAAGLPLPKRIFAHGWLLFENDKMSKSRGNIVRAEPIQKVMGADALRYFLLREIVFGQDGSFSYDALIGRYNSDLANGLGNLASRTLTMITSVPRGRGSGEAASRSHRGSGRRRPSRPCRRLSNISSSPKAWRRSGA